MSIKTNYNFKGIEVKDAYIRIERLWGSSKEGWTALVGVYNLTQEEVPAVEANEADGIEAVEAYTKTVYNKIDEFNHSVLYTEGERGYESLYKALVDKFWGEAV